MGLDMIPLSRPKAGHEAEFARLWQQLNIAYGRLPNPDPQAAGKRGFWAMLLKGPPKPVDMSPVRARFEEISDPHWSLLGAPVVGRDTVADDWVRDLWAKGVFDKIDKTADAAIARHAGTHVLELLPDCDGFPVLLGSSGERCSLRGEVLRDCNGILTQDDIERAWEPMLAEDLSAWGKRLFAALDRARDQNGITPAEVFDTLDSAENQAGAVACAAKWARYWSSRGHGSDPDF